MARFTEEEAVQATGASRVRSSKRRVFEEVCTDTRALVPGCLFVALKGERFDAHDFVSEAATRGASGAIVEKGRVPSLRMRCSKSKVRCGRLETWRVSIDGALGCQ